MLDSNLHADDSIVSFVAICRPRKGLWFSVWRPPYQAKVECVLPTDGPIVALKPFGVVRIRSKVPPHILSKVRPGYPKRGIASIWRLPHTITEDSVSTSLKDGHPVKAVLNLAAVSYYIPIVAPIVDDHRTIPRRQPRRHCVLNKDPQESVRGLEVLVGPPLELGVCSAHF